MKKLSLPVLAAVLVSGLVMALSAGVEASTPGEDAGRPLRFAFVTDVHLAVGASSIGSLRRCLADLNADDGLDFVVFGGDDTDFGTDEEIALFKQIVDSLRHPHYVLAGNHDANWSESGCNTFLRTFGYETFDFERGGWRFLGCNSGPDMRMAPALVPHESMVWLENLPKGRKSVFFNHYPMDSSVLNYFDVTRALKSAGVRFQIGGHWHRNVAMNYGGIPAVLGRSGLSSHGHAGYNVVRLWDDSVAVSERRIFSSSAVEMAPWYTARLAPVVDTVSYDKDGLPADYPFMRYDVNSRYPQVRERWRSQDDYNIVSGSVVDGNTAYYATASGLVRAVDLRNGRPRWSVQLGGKVFSTPALEGGVLVVGCTDASVYALDTRKSGKVLWRTPTGKSVVASPVIRSGKVYIGASDRVFRCLDLKTGRVVWEYDGLLGHPASTPYIDGAQVVFGAWDRRLYSLDPATGREQWVWEVGKKVRNYSPASTVPVKAAGRIFVAVPDRKVYAIDARTGRQCYVVDGGRDAIGLSSDGRMVYSKTMFGKAYAIDPQSGDKLWERPDSTGYEISPTALVEHSGVLLIPTDKGNLIAMDSSTGDFLWAHKVSVALVNPLQVRRVKDHLEIFMTTMDGKYCLLEAPLPAGRK